MTRVGSKGFVLRALAGLLALPALLLVGALAVAGIVSAIDDATGRSERLAAEREEQGRREFERYTSAIAARGGYMVLHAEAAEYRFPVYGRTCSVGRDRRSHTVEFVLPELPVRHGPCEPPHATGRMVLVHLGESTGTVSGPFWTLGDGCTTDRPLAALAAGERTRLHCPSKNDLISISDEVFVGISAGGVRYSGDCGNLCRVNTSAHGLNAEIYLDRKQVGKLSPVIDRVAAYIRDARHVGRAAETRSVR